MNKSEFLNELEKRIRVLEKNEIEDILAEYSQHIDMRIDSGLTEIEAIKDFGSIDELTAEILEAYHVNPEYERKTEIEDLQTDIKDSKKRKALLIGALFAIWTWIKKICNVVLNGAKKLFEEIKKLFSKIYRALKKGKNEVEYIDKVQPVKSKVNFKQKTNGSKKIYKKAKRRCKGVFEKLAYACLVIFVVLCLLPIVAVGIVSIFTVGLTIIFLVQGYPIIGIFIMLIGLSLCSIAVSGLLVSLIVKRKKEDPEIYALEEVNEISDADETDNLCGEDENK